MIHDQLSFHNVTELAPAPGGGLQLCRFPTPVWPHAEAPTGSQTIRSSNGCEIQFVSDAARVRIYLRSLTGDANLVHLVGNQTYAEQKLENGRIHCLDINMPELATGRNPDNRDASIRHAGGYSPRVYRVYSRGATLAYHGMDAMGATVRPPNPDEVPPRRWLAYGSSITQAGQTLYGYVHCAAQMLEASSLNLGMGGSCWVENAISDHIASREDWDFATFELGINMMRPNWDNESFAEKVEYLLNKVTSAHPSKPLFLITIFNCGTYHVVKPSDWNRDLVEKNEILREAASRYPGQVTLFEGKEIAPDFRGFNVDLLHPAPFAYARMGLNLAAAIEQSGKLTGN